MIKAGHSETTVTHSTRSLFVGIPGSLCEDTVSILSHHISNGLLCETQSVDRSIILYSLKLF